MKMKTAVPEATTTGAPTELNGTCYDTTPPQGNADTDAGGRVRPAGGPPRGAARDGTAAECGRGGVGVGPGLDRSWSSAAVVRQVLHQPARSGGGGRGDRGRVVEVDVAEAGTRDICPHQSPRICWGGGGRVEQKVFHQRRRRSRDRGSGSGVLGWSRGPRLGAARQELHQHRGVGGARGHRQRRWSMECGAWHATVTVKERECVRFRGAAQVPSAVAWDSRVGEERRGKGGLE